MAKNLFLFKPSCNAVQIFIIFFIMINSLFFSAQTNIVTREYRNVDQINTSIESSTYPSRKASSVLSCSMYCSGQDSDSFTFQKTLEDCQCDSDSFTFDHIFKDCQCGQCRVVSSSRDPDQVMYTSCDSNNGFYLVTNDSLQACIWKSQVKVNYTDARDACTTKSAYLYTVKTQVKLWLLKSLNQNQSGVVWVGLDDMVVEDEFRWTDDNSLCLNETCRQLIFNAGEPNNVENIEDCVSHKWDEPSLNDIYCNEAHDYICEKPCFNFP